MSTVFSNAALKTELLTDPLGLGYSTALTAGDDNTLADMLNQVREGGGFQVNRDPVTPGAIFGVIDPDEYAGLTSTNLQRLATAFTVPTINLGDDSILDIMTGIFPGGSLTNQAIVTLSKRQGSRAEVLWGTGLVITSNVVNTARTM